MNYHCAKFYINISTNMDTTNIFPFLTIFFTESWLFYPQNSNFWTYSAWHYSLYRYLDHKPPICKISRFYQKVNHLLIFR